MATRSAFSVRENIPLAPYTTLGVGGPARYLAQATNEGDVQEALEFALSRNLPVFILGGGSNIIVSDTGFRGLVLHIALRGVRPLGEEDSDVLTAAAGEEWDAFVCRCVERSLAGVEGLSGIPGTVGGTPIQNVGAYGQEVRDVILSVRVLDRETAEVTEFSNYDCKFGYRTSIFNTTHRDRHVILAVSYGLRADGKAKWHHPELQSFFAERRTPPSLGEVRDAVLKIRAAKGMVLASADPDSKSAGSFFKNPVVSRETALRIEESVRPERLPQFEAPGGMVKLPAAWLIERAGFTKGYTLGHAGISGKHALALVNRGGATAQEILDVAHKIQTGVQNTFDIELVPEPVFVGFDE